MSERTRAGLALTLAGFGWGMTGLFVRALQAKGFDLYETLILRLAVAGFVILPFFAFTLYQSAQGKTSWRALGHRFRWALALGISMAVYYLGAITAFRNLQLVVAAMIIGSSPLIAWVTPLLAERRGPSKREVQAALGVAIATLGLFILVVAKPHQATPVQGASGPQNFNQDSVNLGIGYVGAFAAAIMTVLNSRLLRRLGPLAPKPAEISAATVFVALTLAPIFIRDAGHALTLAIQNFGLAFGFGIMATAIPGLAIAYASVRLAPQVSSTVSIQLQLWSGILAWALLGERMTGLQVLAAALVVLGTIGTGPIACRWKRRKSSDLR